MGIIITIITILLAFKLTGLVFKLLGKMLGVTFGLIGYLIIGVVGVTIFGFAIAFIPIILVIAIISIVVGASKVV